MFSILQRQLEVSSELSLNSHVLVNVSLKRCKMEIGGVK